MALLLQNTFWQALEIICQGDSKVNVRFWKSGICVVKSDAYTGIYSKVELVKCNDCLFEINQEQEMPYSEKVLNSIASFTKAEQVVLTMYEEGILEFCINLNENAWVKHFIKPISI